MSRSSKFNPSLTVKNISKDNSLNNNLVAVSNELIALNAPPCTKDIDYKPANNWSITQKKLLFMCLSKFKWALGENPTTIELLKSEIKEILGSSMDKDEDKGNFSAYIRDEFFKLSQNSAVRVENPKNKNQWIDGYLITTIESIRGKIIVDFNPKFMFCLQLLAQNFSTIWTNDIYKMTNNNTYNLYMYLRQHSDTRKINEQVIPTKKFKDIFNMTEQDYMRKDGTFDRYNFEKKVIERALKEINTGEMIHIYPANDGKLYEKVKKDGSVQGYKIRFKVNSYVNIDSQNNYYLTNKSPKELKEGEINE